MSDYPILQECTKTSDGHYMHTPCGELLDVQKVNHSVYMKGTIAGFGEVVTELVPYCGTCGTPPSPHGSPVYYD